MKEYPDLVKTTGLGTITGLFGINCRHSIFPATPETKPVKTTPRFVTIEGKTYSLYECEQKQRLFERQLRALKRKLLILESLKIDSEVAKIKQYITATQARLRALCKAAGLSREHLAEQV